VLPPYYDGFLLPCMAAAAPGKIEPQTRLFVEAVAAQTSR
jgi:hypothetical protein